jgi:hypothetical protein
MLSQEEDYMEDNVTWEEQIMDFNACLDRFDGKVDAMVTNQNVMVENHNAMMAAISEITEKLGKVVSSETFTAGQTAGNVNVTRRLATTTRSTPPRLSNPLQNSQPFESANFRHQGEQSQEAKEDPSTAPTILTGSPYFRTRLSSANNFDLPRADSALVRSIANIDSTTGPQSCSNCVEYGIKNGVFACYCANCADIISRCRELELPFFSELRQ